MKRIMKKYIISLCLMYSSILLAQPGWFTLPTSIPESVYDIHFISNDTGFIDFNTHITMKTEDGGMSWLPYVNAGKKRFFPINGLLFNIGYYTGSTGRSTDRGKTWEPMQVRTADDSSEIIDYRRFEMIDFVTPAIGYAVKSNSLSTNDSAIYLSKTIDSGRTWVEKKVLIGKSVRYASAIEFRDEMHGMISWSEFYDNVDPRGIWGYRLSYTSNGGATWKTEIWWTITSITYIDGKWLLDSPILSYSTDDGMTWGYSTVRKTGGGLSGFVSTPHSGESIVYVVRSFNIWKSTDGGLTFDEQKLPIASYLFQYNGWQGNGDRIDFPTSEVGYIVGFELYGGDTSIFKTIDGGGLPLSADDQIDQEYEVLVNPNPSNNFIEITFDGLEQATTIIEVFDALGRRMAKEVIPPQASSHRLDVRSYPPGVYYARLGSQTVRFIKQ